MKSLEALDLLEKNWGAAKPVDWAAWATEAEAFCAALPRIAGLDASLLRELRRRAGALQAKVAMSWEFHRDAHRTETQEYSSAGVVEADRSRPRMVLQG